MKTSALSSLRMSQEDVTVHKVHHNSLWVFGRMGTSGYAWPEFIEHHGRKFYFVTNEVMPGDSGHYYTGYAKFECREEQRHVTHKEFGMYLTAIGSRMVEANVRFSDANPSRLVVPYLVQRFGMTEARAKLVDEWCWSKLRCVSVNTANE